MLKANNKKVIDKVKITGFWGKFRGLMFRKKNNFDYALVFDMGKESRIGCSLHMLFVFFPIDVLFLDSKKRVVDKAQLNPWQLNYTPKMKARYVIELPKGYSKTVSLGEKVDYNL